MLQAIFVMVLVWVFSTRNCDVNAQRNGNMYTKNFLKSLCAITFLIQEMDLNIFFFLAGFFIFFLHERDIGKMKEQKIIRYGERERERKEKKDCKEFHR